MIRKDAMDPDSSQDWGCVAIPVKRHSCLLLTGLVLLMALSESSVVGHSSFSGDLAAS